MPTVYFSAYKGRGYASKEDIPEDVTRNNTRRCEGLAAAIARFGRPTTGVYKGRFEPSFVVNADPVDALPLARAACAIFGQECALVFTGDYPEVSTHIRVTIPPRALDAVLGSVFPAPDGYTILPDGAGVLIVPIQTHDGPWSHGCLVEYGTAEFVTP